MSRARRLAIVVALAFAAVWPPTPHAADPDPILILVSFDGWRWDYIDRLPAPNLRALASRGVRASELIPSFPALTFPNHYTIVTGLYPEHHGIVANTMADPSLPERFSMSAETAKDAVWWRGEPLWVTAIRQGRRAATMFWPGSEVAIGGVRPTYWKPYDKQLPSTDRVSRALEWLALPEPQRPAFVSLYFEAVDSAGHDYGVESPELVAAARELDAALGQLVGGVTRLGLDGRTTIVVVSDHGMTPLSYDRLIYLDGLIDLDTVNVLEWTGTLELSPRDGDVEALYRRLRGKDPHLAVYTREQLPARLHYRHNPRIPAIVGIPDDGWAVVSDERLEEHPLNAAAHGFDPANRSMHALFAAAGPRVRRGIVVAPFENVHIYNVLCAVLRVAPSKNDGDRAMIRRLLEDN